MAAEFAHLKETGRHSIQQGKFLRGLCYDDKVFCVEELLEEEGTCTHWLSMYDIRPGGRGLRLQDSVDLGGLAYRPRVDRHCHRVYVPCDRRGVMIFRCQEICLVTVATLKCVADAFDVAVNSVDTVYVCDTDRYKNDASVCLVDVDTDTVIRRIEKPHSGKFYGLSDLRVAYYVAVSGESVLVSYDDNALVMYRADGDTHHWHVLNKPRGLDEISSITAGKDSSFLLSSFDGSVFILDSNLLLWRRIHTGGNRLWDCCIIDQSQLWLGYRYGSGHIAVMKSQ